MHTREEKLKYKKYPDYVLIDIILDKDKEINKYKETLDKIKEWKKQTLFELNRQYKTFEYWEELFEDLDKLLEEIDE